MTIDDPKGIRVVADEHIEAPAMTIASISLRTIFTKTSMHEASGQHEVVAASLLVYPNCRIDRSAQAHCSHVHSLARPLASGAAFPPPFTDQLRKQHRRVDVHRGEQQLLQALLALLEKYDPDVLIGHDIVGFTLPVLAARLRALNADRWHRLGRLIWRSWPKGVGLTSASSWGDRQLASGRLLVDTYLSAKVRICLEVAL